MKAFLNNICIRESCYNCSFKKKYRNSDITLADYWGIDKIHPEMNDDKGISLVVVNLEKGIELFDSIKNNLNYKETNLDDAIRFNPSMIKSANKPKTREKFFRQLEEDEEFDVLVENNVPKKTILRRIFSKCKSIVKRVLKRS